MAPYKKTQTAGGPHLVFLDESEFLVIPNVKRTRAPKSQTPYLYHLYEQDRLSSINALAVSPKRRRLALYSRVRARNLTGLDVQSFLRHLLLRLRGPMALPWDRGPIHRHRVVKVFIRDRLRIQWDYFPAYASELNPAAYV